MKKAILLMTMILFVSGTITLNAYAASQSVNDIKLTDQRMDDPMVKLMVFGTICEMESMGI